MHSPGKRRLTVLDLMILIASFAAGLALDRLYNEYWPMNISGRGYVDSFLDPPHLVLMAMSLGAVVLRLLPPRPTLRRLTREPGTLALIGVLVTIVTMSVRSIPDWAAFHRGEFFGGNAIHGYLCLIASPLNLGPMMVLAWSIGLVQGLHWRRADWVEWLGRALGVTFVASWIIRTVLACFG